MFIAYIILMFNVKYIFIILIESQICISTYCLLIFKILYVISYLLQNKNLTMCLITSYIIFLLIFISHNFKLMELGTILNLFTHTILCKICYYCIH